MGAGFNCWQIDIGEKLHGNDRTEHIMIFT